ncbi:MAG TPA: hypothetical protein VHX16_03520, partial [Chloroflexota bacterium]|nr:hypothetical protein [Chloroflexota bacterium]
MAMHELSEGTICGFAQLLRRQAERAESPAAGWLDRGIGRIQDASNRLVLLLEEIVEMARARAGGSFPLEMCAMDLAVLTAEVAFAAQASSGRGVSVV